MQGVTYRQTASATACQAAAIASKAATDKAATDDAASTTVARGCWRQTSPLPRKSQRHAPPPKPTLHPQHPTPGSTQPLITGPFITVTSPTQQQDLIIALASAASVCVLSTRDGGYDSDAAPDTLSPAVRMAAYAATNLGTLVDAARTARIEDEGMGQVGLRAGDTFRLGPWDDGSGSLEGLMKGLGPAGTAGAASNNKKREAEGAGAKRKRRSVSGFGCTSQRRVSGWLRRARWRLWTAT